MSPAPLPELLRTAWARRTALHDDEGTTAYRAFHGHGEGRPGLVIERLGDVFVARCGRGPGWALEEAEVASCAAFIQEVGGTTLVVRRPREPADVVLGSLASDGIVHATELGLTYHFEPLTGANAGLYLDARAARACVRVHAEGRRILNLFAWTGGFGVAAMAGGALSAMHVDEQKRAFKRVGINHELNAQQVDRRDFVRGDVYRFLRQSAKPTAAARFRFGGIVIDAPPIVHTRGAQGQDYERLVPLALPLLGADGWVLCTFSRREMPRAAYEDAILEASAGALAVEARGGSGVDFPEDDPEQKLRFTVFRRM